MTPPTEESAIEVSIKGKDYAIIRICMFHDIPVNGEHGFKTDAIKNLFGLKNTFTTSDVYEIVDKKKYMLAKIKYGI